MRYQSMIFAGVIFLAAPLVVLPAAAETIHVPGDYATIEAALQVAYPFDEVLVAPGVYFEYALVVPAHVHLAGSGDDPSDVIIDAQGQGRVLTVEGGLTRVENLSLHEGAADQGGGLLILGGVGFEGTMISDVHITGCEADLGGGVLARTGQPIFDRCIFSSNIARTAGGGLFALDASSLIMRDCVFYENQAGAYGGAWSAARCSVTLTGCTVVGNQADIAAEGAAFGGLGVEISETIAADNLPEAGFTCVESMLLSDLENRVTSTCDLRWQPGWAGYLQDQLDDPANGNLHSDPLICFESGGSWAALLGVAANSPCLPQNNDGCGLIGAYGEACGPVAVPETPIARCVLHPAFPNPFNPVTNVSYEIGRAGPVSLVIYGLDGRRVATLVNEDQAAGIHSATWAGLDDRGRSVASGVYICRLLADQASAVIRLTMIK